MTEYELNDLLLTQQSGINTTLGLYLTLVSGYLIAAFLAGKKLDRGQVWMISVMFAVAASIQVAVIFNRFTDIIRLSTELGLIAENPPERLSGIVPIFLFVTLICGIGASLIFMRNVRRSRPV